MQSRSQEPCQRRAEPCKQSVRLDKKQGLDMFRLQFQREEKKPPRTLQETQQQEDDDSKFQRFIKCTSLIDSGAFP